LKNIQFFIIQLGKSGVGKTSVVIACLLAKTGIAFQYLYIVTKTPHQSCYQLTKTVCEGLQNFKLLLTSDIDQLPNLDQIPKYSCIIFDDFGADKKFLERIAPIISYTRHYCISIFIITHSCTKLNRGLVRANSNFLVLFEVDVRTLRHIYEEHISNIISFEKLKEISSFAWKEHSSFLCIDLTNSVKSEIFRIGFDLNLEI
jgi:hypothetical protein